MIFFRAFKGALASPMVGRTTTFLTTTGAYALAMIIAFPMTSARADCVENGDTAVCTGDLSAGVVLGSASLGTVTINSDTPITPAMGRAAIDISGNDVATSGLRLIDITANVPGGISATGPMIQGINAGLGTPENMLEEDGEIIIDSVANIVSSGDTLVQAISSFIVGNGDITVTSVGNLMVMASSVDALGEALRAAVDGMGDVSVTSTGNIAATNLTGITALTRIGDVDVTVRGDISTTGHDSAGLNLSTSGGAITVDNVGDISTAGNASLGIAVAHNGDASVIHRGDITATGPASAGIGMIEGTDAAMGSNFVIDSQGTISANGDSASVGILFSSDSLDTVLDLKHTGDVTGGRSAFLLQTPGEEIVLQIFDGTIIGGTEAGITFSNVVGAENADFQVLIDAASSLSATSGNAILSQAGETTVVNQGMITGSVELRADGRNSFFNLEGAIFETDAILDIGEDGTIGNAGTLRPFGTGSLGTTTVTGDLIMVPGSSYETDISEMGSDATSVAGNLQLAGNLVINAVGAQSSFSVNDLFSLLDARDGITGGFAAVTDNLAGLDLVPIWNNDRTQLLAVVTADGTFVGFGCAVSGITVLRYRALAIWQTVSPTLALPPILPRSVQIVWKSKISPAICSTPSDGLRSCPKPRFRADSP